MDSTYLKAIGARIRKARVERGINQADLADMMDIATSHLSNIETGRSNFGIDILIKIAEALQVSTDEILRPDVPSGNAAYASDLMELLQGCTPAEKEAMLETLRSMKSAFKSNK